MSALRDRPRGSQLALAPERTRRDGEHSRRERSRCPGGGRLTLELQLDRVWEGLSAVGVGECPLCGGRMELHASQGRCTSCGTAVS